MQNSISNSTGKTTRRIKQVEPDSKLVKERYLLDNGAHEVVLVDSSEATWEAYCKEIACYKKPIPAALFPAFNRLLKH
jgi:hypothetical protein